jgi:polysaccharide export outer membrane protein
VVPVRPDGMISLPLVNDIQAAGRTPMELRDTLAAKLAEFVAAPGVSVIVSEIRSFKISVLGEVTKPGRYEVNGHTTVLDAIAMAEGFTEYAKKGNVVILRAEGATTRRVHFDYGYAVSDPNGRGNWVLRPGDIVVVP